MTEHSPTPFPGLDVLMAAIADLGLTEIISAGAVVSAGVALFKDYKRRELSSYEFSYGSLSDWGYTRSGYPKLYKFLARQKRLYSFSGWR